MIALAALMFVGQTEALAANGHVPASVDSVKAHVKQMGAFSVVGLDDWALTVEGGFICRSEPGVSVILSVDPVTRKEARKRSSSEAGPTRSTSQFSLMVIPSTATPLPHQSTGFCLVMDNHAVLRELQFELFISNDVSSSETLVAHRLPQGA